MLSGDRRTGKELHGVPEDGVVVVVIVACCRCCPGGCCCFCCVVLSFAKLRLSLVISQGSLSRRATKSLYRNGFCWFGFKNRKVNLQTGVGRYGKKKRRALL